MVEQRSKQHHQHSMSTEKAKSLRPLLRSPSATVGAPYQDQHQKSDRVSIIRMRMIRIRIRMMRRIRRISIRMRREEAPGPRWKI